MKKSYFFTLFLLLFLASISKIFAQNSTQIPAKNLNFQYNFQPNTEGLPLSAWAGGLNSPQIYAMDINQDLEEDLVVFDKHNSKFYTFTANIHSKKFIYRPEFEQYFPPCKAWVVIVDYDKDGKKDIFTHNEKGGVKIFKNIGKQNPEFELLQENITSKSLNNPTESNIIIPATDMPAIVDIDDDGDLDIFTFDFAQGNWIEFYENITPLAPKSPLTPKGGTKSPKKPKNLKEETNPKDTLNTKEKLVFFKKNPCWGGILEQTNCGEFQFNKACAGGSGKSSNIMHAGSTLQIVDLNGDKKLDVLIGDISCNELYFFKNQGTNARPKFTQFDRNFPKNNPIRVLFPAVYFVDVTFDKIPDMLVVPNVWQQDGEVADWDKSIWVYENKNTTKKPDWQLTQKDFLQNEMLDFGENVSAFSFDIDNDKDMDLLVSARKTNGNIENTFLENKGTNKNPIFAQNKDFTEKYLVDSLKNKIFQNHFIYKSNYLQNYISYLEKKDNNFYFFYKNIKLDEFHKFPFSLQKNDSPALIDIDEDGDIDMCIAKGNGSMIYYENIRIKNQNQNKISKKEDFNEDKFEAEKSLFGTLPNPASTELRIATHDLNADGQVDLLMTDANGKIDVYLDIAKKFKDFETTKEFSPDIRANSIEKLYCGSGVFPQISDIDGDEMPDLVMGMRTGGIKFIKNTTEKPKVIAKYHKKDNLLVINVPFEGQLRGENAQGELLLNIAVEDFKGDFPVKLTEKQIQGLKISHRNPRYKTLWLKNLVIVP